VPPMPAMAELPGKEEAFAILRDGNPKQEMLRTFALDHEGDETVAECLILSIASRAVLNTNGLHVSVTVSKRAKAISPLALRLPYVILRMSTNRRMARSLTLLVGSTPSWSMNVNR
jgi:hypothetical protein